jgi:acetylornithine/N-succinyldiaminopimelate aminotransferase
VLKNKVLDNVINLGDKLFKGINLLSLKYPKLIKGVRGKGLMIGIICNINNAELCSNLRNEGLLSVPAGDNVLRLLPPLNITAEHADICLKILEKTLKKLEVN